MLIYLAERSCKYQGESDGPKCNIQSQVSFWSKPDKSIEPISDSFHGFLMERREEQSVHVVR